MESAASHNHWMSEYYFRYMRKRFSSALERVHEKSPGGLTWLNLSLLCLCCYRRDMAETFFIHFDYNTSDILIWKVSRKLSYSVTSRRQKEGKIIMTIRMCKFSRCASTHLNMSTRAPDFLIKSHSKIHPSVNFSTSLIGTLMHAWQKFSRKHFYTDFVSFSFVEHTSHRLTVSLSLHIRIHHITFGLHQSFSRSDLKKKSISWVQAWSVKCNEDCSGNSNSVNITTHSFIQCTYVKSLKRNPAAVCDG